MNRSWTQAGSPWTAGPHLRIHRLRRDCRLRCVCHPLRHPLRLPPLPRRSRCARRRVRQCRAPRHLLGRCGHLSLQVHRFRRVYGRLRRAFCDYRRRHHIFFFLFLVVLVIFVVFVRVVFLTSHSLWSFLSASSYVVRSAVVSPS